jgi:hypothetical protein
MRLLNNTMMPMKIAVFIKQQKAMLHQLTNKEGNASSTKSRYGGEEV